jgi:hypothetical protein
MLLNAILIEKTHNLKLVFLMKSIRKMMDKLYMKRRISSCCSIFEIVDGKKPYNI